MNCQQVMEDWMQRYLDQDLTPDETAQLYKHIAVCAECAEHFQMIKLLSRDLEDLPPVTMPFSLVDSILPQLDAIDRARDERLAEAARKPAEMIPEPRRTPRSSGWWGTIAGRTAIGAAAAAVVLGAAIFSYEPKQLSDAEIPYQSEQSNMTANSSIAESETEMQQEDVPDANSTVPEEQQPLMKEEGSADQAEGGTEVLPDTPPETPVESRQETPKETRESAAPDGQESSNERSTTKTAPSQDSKSSGETEKPQVKPDKSKSAAQSEPSSETNNNPQEAPSGSDPEAALPPAEDSTAADAEVGNKSDEPPAAEDPSMNDEPAVEAEENFIFGMASMLAPLQWDAPDGLHRAQLEGDQLVLYQVPKSEDPPAVIQSLPLQGEWITGQWSEDSKTFTYWTMVDGTEKQHVYSLEKQNSKEDSSAAEVPPPAKTPARSEPPTKTERAPRTP
ncbi:zf-HC2 domain-containing protein [Paenibacillus lemnae]|uniref:Anti-sigma-W factor RsiW n=1 Tax=Paenibacillus lemnae TaxID=1330551 RepID=A0A848M5I0_PAELE|nr:zf-HC2 domain-containing protein [Paenibacillus lemnae]NMO94864.1 anti-sigma factor [Paenibacillus lemnae]